MNSTPAEPALDTLLPDDPVDMDMSGFETPESPFLQALEAGSPTDSEADFSFPDLAVGEYASDSLAGQVSVFLDRRVWSSLAVVLLLHATFAWVFPICVKPPAENPRMIEAQLVTLPGGSDRAGGGRPAQADPKAAGGGAKSVCPAQRAAVPSSPVVPVQKEPVKLHQTAKIDAILQPERKIHPRVKKRYGRIARVFHHREKRHEIDAIKPIERSKNESGTIQSHVLGQSGAKASPGIGKGGGIAAGGAGEHGGTGNVNGPGGSGPSEFAFGSPHGPRFLHEVTPCYPALARRLEKQGTVLLRVTIDTHGRPVKVEVLRKAGFGMDEEAVKAVEESTFVPAKSNGQPLTCRALLPIKFILESS